MALQVNNVIVQCTLDGKSVMVQLDPTKVRSVFFDEDEMVRARSAIGMTSEHRFTAGTAIPADIDGDDTGARFIQKVPDAVAAAGQVLWWHTGVCSWFHPEDQ